MLKDWLTIIQLVSDETGNELKQYETITMPTL